MLKLDDSSCSGRNYNERAVNNTTNERSGWLVQHVWICARVTNASLCVELGVQQNLRGKVERRVSFLSS